MNYISLKEKSESLYETIEKCQRELTQIHKDMYGEVYTHLVGKFYKYKNVDNDQYEEYVYIIKANTYVERVEYFQFSYRIEDDEYSCFSAGGSDCNIIYLLSNYEEVIKDEFTDAYSNFISRMTAYMTKTTIK